MVLNKKGYFFSLDAFIAFLIVIGVILVVKPPLISIEQDIRLQDDLIKSLSSVQIGELNNSYAKLLILNGSITDLNKSVLEQIGEFYAKGDPQGILLAQDIFSQLDVNTGLALYFENNLIANNTPVNFSEAKIIKTSRQIISGIAGNVSASSGFSSRAFLYSENKIKYFYFGGYVGDGNVSMNIGYDVSNAIIEGIFSGDFDLYINDQFVSNYTPTSDVPYTINLINETDKFSSSQNNISFRSNKSFNIGGGFIKVIYNSSTFDPFQKQIPGITGFINLYDGFYIPGQLNSMEVYLHYNSPYNIFIDIAGTKVYSGNSSGSDLAVTLTDSDFSGLLDYQSLSEKTVPLRIGYVNISNVTATDTDTFSVVDISGSMNENEVLCGGSNKLMDCASNANSEFVSILTSVNQIRVGLTGYKAEASLSNYHNLSNNETSLNEIINSWSPGGGSCLCCGINRAIEGFNADSNESTIKSMVVMGDGKPNGKCTEQNTGSADGDAVQAACDAYNDYGIKVYAIGFGTDLNEVVLQDIASCGNGDYYFSNVTDLTSIYSQIADDILSASYVSQSIVGTGVTNYLYPDSRITFDYNSTLPYGIVLSSETETFGNNVSTGNFTIPGNSTPYNIGVVSYTGNKWTYLVEIFDNVSDSWKTIFNLSNYTDIFTDIGDPYIVNIPTDEVKIGENQVRVSVADNSTNISGGSEYNKVLYSIIRDVSSYSEVLPTANGCVWHIEFEDGTNTTINFPESYSGSDNCYYAEDDYFFAGDNVVLGNSNDAVSNALLNLLEVLDLNSNNKVETKFTEGDLSLDSVEIEGLPFTWDTEVQVRSWR